MSIQKLLSITLSGIIAICCNSQSLQAGDKNDSSSIKCELKLTGKHVVKTSHGEFTIEDPTIGVIKITNISSANIDIGSVYGPEGLLDIKIKDPMGTDMKTDPLATLISAKAREKSYILKPDEVFQHTIGLMSMVPKKQRIAGVYKVKAVCIYNGKEYLSNEVDVKLPADEKK